MINLKKKTKNIEMRDMTLNTHSWNNGTHVMTIPSKKGFHIKLY